LEKEEILFYSKSGGAMYTYDLLEAGCYYLVKEKEDSMIYIDQGSTGNRSLFIYYEI
jgi:hypothetical protein